MVKKRAFTQNTLELRLGQMYNVDAHEESWHHWPALTAYGLIINALARWIYLHHQKDKAPLSERRALG